ncbi:MAG: tetratricopeptide repeat-containing sulfotransferase family protein [Ruegeria sp.]
MSNQTAKTLKVKALGDLDTGKLPQALKKAQIGAKKFPKDPDFQAIAGFVLTEMKQYKRSIPFFVEASRMKPDNAEYVENLANALMQTGQIVRALSYAEQKSEEFPTSKELVRVIDEIQLKGQNWRKIIEYATKKLEKDPDNAELLTSRARAFGKIGFTADSSKDINRAYELSPEKISVAVPKAHNLHQSGDKAGCAEILKAVLDKKPDNIAALYQLSSIIGKDEVGMMLAQVQKAIDGMDHVNSQLEFAKAQLISKGNGLEAALPQFALANDAQHELNPYNFALEETKLNRICGVFPADSTLPSSELVESPVPIFVVGQPRSGTTLMEMMLSTAPDIAGCGELTLGADLSRNSSDDGVVFDASAARKMAEDFRELMPPIPEDSTAFVDKMPHNFQRVGFLLAAFPNAKVINMLRDPRDVGLSKWIRRFPAPGMRYASNLKSIAHSANLYRRYMAHWDKIFGDRILTVPYEELVADPKTYSRKVTDFCGIEWRESMVHPEKNTGIVRTASIDQVRNKISTKSIGGWRDVADHIQPMLDGFDPELWPEYDLG